MRILGQLTLRKYSARTEAETAKVRRGILETWFEAQVRTNMVYLCLNPRTPLLYKSGVRYRREGAPEVWLDIPAIRHAGADDCEGLASWLAAECRVKAPNSLGAKKRPAAVVALKKTRRRGLWHAIVLDKETGEVFDPSRKLGMGSEEDG